MHLWDQMQNKIPDFLFGKYRCPHLELNDNATSVKSTIHD